MTKKRFRKLDPIKDSKGLIRANGRLSQVDLPEEVKHPILLLGKHPLTHLLAIHYHHKLLHQGYRVVLTNLSNIGIVIRKGREVLKSVANKCVFCRIRRRKCLEQKMGILPAFRIQPSIPPFTSVAVDFFENLKIKQSRNVSVNGLVLIITCMTTRRIYLELCLAFDTNSFLRAWRRFATIRGIHPTHVFSDVGTTLKGGSSPIAKLVQDWDCHFIEKESNEFGTHVDFQWSFNVPTASHMNGVVESLINSVRKGLDALVVNYTRSLLTYEELVTVLAEVTYVINSRPLLPEGDPSEFTCITRNSLLHPYGQPQVCQSAPMESFSPRDLLKVIQYQVDIFWNTWMKHMSPELNCRNKWFHTRDDLEPYK